MAKNLFLPLLSTCTSSVYHVLCNGLHACLNPESGMAGQTKDIKTDMSAKHATVTVKVRERTGRLTLSMLSVVYSYVRHPSINQLIQSLWCLIFIIQDCAWIYDFITILTFTKIKNQIRF